MTATLAAPEAAEKLACLPAQCPQGVDIGGAGQVAAIQQLRRHVAAQCNMARDGQLSQDKHQWRSASHVRSGDAGKPVPHAYTCKLLACTGASWLHHRCAPDRAKAVGLAAGGAQRLAEAKVRHLHTAQASSWAVHKESN